MEFFPERMVVLCINMIRDFDKLIVGLDTQIAAEEDRTRIKDTGHPAYSTLAIAAAKRRQNLLSSVAHTKSMLDVVRHELDELTVQLRRSRTDRKPGISPVGVLASA